MPLSKQEAAEALKYITLTERRSGEVHAYQTSSPFLILWGVLWAIGYTVSYFRPAWGSVWLALVVIGVIGSFWLGARVRPTKAKGYDWRFSASSLAVFFFIFALFSILPPTSNAQVGAFFPILVALYYGLIGIWTRAIRMMFTGAALAILTLVGFFYLPQYFLLWMAFVGGGGLILGGLWFRKV